MKALASVAGIALALLLAAGCSKAPREAVALAPAKMNPTGQKTTDAGGAVTFWGKGVLQSVVHIEKGPVTITLRCRGNTVDNEAPIVMVEIEARVVGKLVIDSTETKDFSLATNALNTGTTMLRLTFPNAKQGATPAQARAVRVEMVTVS
ncbi:MAG: hypothetical protein ABSA52_19820 [Candidatus Binatia bacterium]